MRIFILLVCLFLVYYFSTQKPIDMSGALEHTQSAITKLDYEAKRVKNEYPEFINWTKINAHRLYLEVDKVKRDISNKLKNI